MKGHIRRRGEHSWELKFDLGLDEKTGRRITQFHSFKGTKKEAEQKLRELLGSVDKGSYVSKSNLTVVEHVTSRIAQWEALQKISPKTAERYRELLADQIIPHIGQIPLQKLKAADIESWHATLKTAGRKDGRGGLSHQTIHHAHRLLSKALKEGMRHDLVARNVASLEQPPKVERKEVAVLSRDQVKLLVERLRGHAMYPIAITALFTGMRRGELLALKWNRVDLDAKQITVCEAVEETRGSGIRFKTPKTNSGVRNVTLPDIVIETLRSHRRQQLEVRVRLGLGKLADDALVFPAVDGSPQPPKIFSITWARLAESIGLPEATFHSLRHSHASFLIDAGIDVVKISKRLGHANPTITLNVYAHLLDKRDDKSSAAINATVASLFAG
jgi:integrase